MVRRLLILSLALVVSGSSGGIAAEKLKYASAPRESIIQNLPVFAALEKGFWEKNGLEIKWTRTRSSRDLFRGIVSGDIEVASTLGTSVVRGLSSGVPIKIISNLHKDSFSFWVVTNSPMSKPDQIKGTRIGVLAMGTAAHAYGWMVAKALGLGKDVKFVASGGVTSTMAALTTGSIEVSVNAYEVMIPLRVRGRVRELINVDDYRPKEWLAYVHFAGKLAVRNRPEVLKQANRAILQATRAILEDRSWTVERIKQAFRWPEEAAKVAYPRLSYSRTGRTDPQALRNVANLLVDFGIIKKEKVPPVEDLYTNEFLR